ncbi:MAG TPA: tryptophan--tRNA ligase [Candidatus Paceibacterota bacterium]|nr:tryptophan--tRNA ligase [Candidatus Paceibacterota bacterium]
MPKTLLSGVKPTGRPHIGNYFGALKQFVDLQNQYDCYIMIADYHALNFIQNSMQMRELTLNLAIDYLAIGLDPKKVVLFKQSDISAHTELAWIFDTITTMPYLMRAHAYKDAEAKEKEIGVGTFNYPMLMAADILLYSPDVVPVGQDQKQHIEYTRDTAEKFNRIFGETFKLPQELIEKKLSTIPGSIIGTDGYKMSKSRNNTIPLFASDEEIKKLVMSIVTDSGENGAINVQAIHYPIRTTLYPNEKIGDYFSNLYTEKKGKYKELKEALITDLIKFITPLRKNREEWAKNPEKVLKILAEGAEKANKVASAKMLEVKKAVGVN